MDDQSDALTVDILRQVFRGLEQWRLAYAADTSLQTVVNDGIEWNILDVERLYDASQQLLTVRQAQAIRLFLVGNMRESDVAVAMGIKPSNPIGLYATEGLHQLIEMVDARFIRSVL